MSDKIDKQDLKKLNESNFFFTGDLLKYRHPYSEKEKLLITKSLDSKDEINFQKLEEIVSKFLCSLKYQFLLEAEEKNLKNSNQTKVKKDLIKSIQKFKKLLLHVEKDHQQVVDEIDQTYHEIAKQRRSNKAFLANQLTKIKSYDSYEYFDDLSSANFYTENSYNFFGNICRDLLIKSITELEITLHLSIKNNKKGGPEKKPERRKLVYDLKKFYEFYAQKEFGYNKDFKRFFYSVVQPIENLQEYAGSGIAKSNPTHLCSTWKDLIIDLRKSC